MIRPYTPADKEQLIHLLKLNTPTYFDSSEEQDFREYFDRHLESYFVVEEDGQLVGCGGINYFPDDRLARITWDIIHPDHQGRGLGKELTLFRINEIRKNPEVELVVVRTTQQAYQFYEKGGFRLEKMEKDYWAEGFDLYYMTLPLAGGTP
ncbi:GNAT family N-acetyltransferase [Telluribacter sp.]|jgi:ribosomal protein S18 acetylase RimI-like enzyme|uniref:GNAT family N-acetyltransferase n=1 Tax=Telluribacter sp. TaxID=1978767 RepID=UPI002E0E49EF|nr:GNAT family N-acetyltransferase [Telluribacter sp.]